MDVTTATSTETEKKTHGSSKSEVTKGGGSSATSGLADDFNSFLKLFLTQLENQDPTDPLDTNEMTDQLVQFSQVEQQINTNTKLDSILNASSTSSLNSALSFVDKYVEHKGDEMNFYGTRSEFAYKVATLAENVNVTIMDADGKVVRSVGDLDGTAGKKNSVFWDGTNDAGVKVAAGQYKIKVEATATNGKKIDTETYVTDFVTEVDISGADVVLHMGNIKVNAADVISIKANALYQGTTGSTGNTTGGTTTTGNTNDVAAEATEKSATTDDKAA